MLTPPLTFSRYSEVVKRKKDKKRMTELHKRKLRQRLPLKLKPRLRLTLRRGNTDDGWDTWSTS